MLKLATLEDLGSITRMLRSFHEASQYASLPYSESKIVAQFERTHLLREDFLWLLSTEEYHGPVGILVATKHELLFSDARSVTELCWWIDKDFRNLKRANSMIEAFEYWANLVKAGIISLAREADLKSTDALYRRKGFKLAELTYMRELVEV